MKHKDLKEKCRALISGRAILTVTKAGTRKFENGKLVDPGEIVAEVKAENIICNEGLQLLAGFVMDESATYDAGVTYCEIGTGTTAPVAGDTALTTFGHRNAVTSRSRSDYVVTISTFFTAAECTYYIEEAGAWGGGDAAAGPATGLLFAHWLASFNNISGVYDVTVTYLLTIARG